MFCTYPKFDMKISDCMDKLELARTLFYITPVNASYPKKNLCPEGDVTLEIARTLFHIAPENASYPNEKPVLPPLPDPGLS